MKQLLFCFCLSSLALAYADEGHNLNFTSISVRSHIFNHLRANKQPVHYTKCGEEVTAPLGYLEQHYTKDAVKSDTLCVWKLKAPANHVVHIITATFLLEDEIKHNGTPEPLLSNTNVSSISFYEGNYGSRLSSLYASYQERTGPFVSSLSSGPEMTVEIKYRNSKDYNTQKIVIYYEFLQVDEMKKALREYNN